MISYKWTLTRRARWGGFCLFFFLLVRLASASSIGNGPGALQNAVWITPVLAPELGDNRPVLFHTAFDSYKRVLSAKLVVTAHGIFAAEVNGGRVGDDYFAPGFTSYLRRLPYREYDVTALLGRHNDLSVTVARGWYSGPFGGDLRSGHYGGDMALLAELVIRYTDGSRMVVSTDSTWKAAVGPVLRTGFYSGELRDGGLSRRDISGVRVLEFDRSNLVRADWPAVKAHERIRALRVFSSPLGEQLADFGQNLAGFVRLRVRGKAGDTVRVGHAETLDKDGNFYTGNLRAAAAQDIYVLTGKGEEVLEPRFTYHGFRYVKVTGLRGALLAGNLTAVALYSDLAVTGTFSCSDTMLNRLQRNLVWSQKSNFMDIPTDCPQRSERLGWTGDVQVICATAAFNFDVRAFLGKWLEDLSADQGANGAVPRVVPDISDPGNGSLKPGIAGWGDAAVMVPWTLYTVYGDTLLLRRQYASMKGWVDFVLGSVNTTDFLWKAGGFGDWYAPGPKTDMGYIDQCFFAHSADLLARSARVLGRVEDAAFYGRVRDQAVVAFRKLYLDKDRADTQTAEVLALAFDLLPDSLRSGAAARLAALIRGNDGHLATGFLGTPYLLPVLSRFGYTELAYQVLGQRTMPSWLYPVTKGATTIWEKWDAVRPDGTFNTASLNHYAYGAVGEWLYSRIGGIRAGSVGYKSVIIHPEIGGGLTWAKCSYRCRYGLIVSNWKVAGKKVEMEVVVPPGTSAQVFVPGGAMRSVGPGKYRFRGVLVD